MSALTQDELVEALERATKRIDALEAESQAVLDVINIYGDDTLHSALDNIGWFKRRIAA